MKQTLSETCLGREEKAVGVIKKRSKSGPHKHPRHHSHLMAMQV